MGSDASRLRSAAREGEIRTVRKMLARMRPDDINQQSPQWGNTALMKAIINGHRDVAVDLLRAGADFNHKNKYGMTALILAVMNRDKQMTIALLKVGADPSVKGNDGRNALVYAKTEEMRQLLLEYMPVVNHCEEDKVNQTRHQEDVRNADDEKKDSDMKENLTSINSANEGEEKSDTTGRIESSLYGWLKTEALVNECDEDIGFAFEQLQKTGCNSKHDIISGGITRDDMKFDMGIPLRICTGIMKTLNNEKATQHTSPSLQLRVSTFERPTSSILLITRAHQLSTLRSSGDSLIVDASYISEEYCPIRNSLSDVKINVKVKISSSEYSPGSERRLQREFDILRFLNKKSPGCFVEVFNLMEGGDVNMSDDCDPYPNDAKIMVMERGEMTLAQYISEYHCNMDVGEKLQICIRIKNIIAAAHKLGIVLMDVKADNMIIVKQDTINANPWKAIDLGGYLKVGDSVQDSDARLTVAHMAPELFAESAPTASFALDIWAYGVIIFDLNASKSFWTVQGISTDVAIKGFMCTLLTEYADDPLRAQNRIDKVIDKTFKQQQNSLRSFLKATLSVDPSNRSSMDYLENKSFLCGGHSISPSMMYNSVQGLRADVKQVKDKMDTNFGGLTRQIEDLSSSLSRYGADVALKLEAIATHDQLKEYCGILQSDVTRSFENAFEEILSSSAKSVLHFCVEDAVAQQKKFIDIHIEEMSNVVNNSTNLHDSQLKIENAKVLSAVNSVQDNVEVLMQKLDAISGSVAMVNANLIFENFDQFVKTGNSMPAFVVQASMEELLSAEVSKFRIAVDKSDDAAERKLINDVKDLLGNVDQSAILVDIMNRLDALCSTQTGLVYGVHDTPLLVTICATPMKTLKRKLKNVFSTSFRVRHLCTVCGKPAESGSKGKGLELSVPKKWFRTLVDCLSLALRALEVAGQLGGLPIPRISSFAESISEALPEDVASFLTDASEELSEFTSQNDIGEIMESVATTDLPLKPSVNLYQIQQLKMLLAALDDEKGENLGLKRAYCSKDGTFTWVCEDSNSPCYERVVNHGRNALLIDVALS